MSTIAEIERAVPQFSANELAELEQFIRKARREKERARKPSLRDIELWHRLLGGRWLSLGAYVTGMGATTGRPPPEGANVAFAREGS